MTTDPSRPYSSDVPPPGGPAASPPPGDPQRGGRGVLAVILAVVGGLVVLAGLIVGAIMLIDSDDDPIPTPSPTGQAPSPTDDPSAEPTDQPEPSEPSDGGELLELLTAEADVVVSPDGTTWVLESGWIAATDLSDQALEGYTGTFTADGTLVTLTALSFDEESAAGDYLEGVQADRGDPDYEGSVWEDGSGTRIDYVGQEYEIFWHDETAIVFHAAGPEGSVEDFYGSLPF